MLAVQAPQPQPFEAQSPSIEIPQEITNGIANVFKAALPNFLAQLAQGR
jgi:hypothetical protein